MVIQLEVESLLQGTIQVKNLFPDLTATIRSDNSFRKMIDEEHYKGLSTLVKMSIGMVPNFPKLDCMHTVCLEVGRRLVLLCMRDPLERVCSSALAVQQLSYSLLLFVP